MDGWVGGWVGGLVDGWVGGLVDGWVGGLVDGWVGGWVGRWIGGWMGRWIGGWMGRWIGGWMGGWIGGWMVRWMDGWLNGWMDGWVDWWMDGSVYGWVGELVNGWVGGWIGGWMDGWMDGWVYGWVDGWMVRCMGGWIHEWVCELTIYKKEQNRIEFKCSDKSTCSHEETQTCDSATPDKCVFCCNNLGTCREQAFLVFSDMFSTTTVRTAPVETDPTTRTTVTATTPSGPNMCIQCSKNEPCDPKTLQSLTPTLCNVEYPYCYTTIIQNHSNPTIYKGCAEHDFCQTKYWQETMHRPECLTGDYAGQVVNCTFCCAGTGCNIPDKPTANTLLQLG
ncbi:hypothetical protein Btru_046069 [Bulinus truncatus]|nr:hypothetical protein Btru_046069 [Bulinus truncatus]